MRECSGSDRRGRSVLGVLGLVWLGFLSTQCMAEPSNPGESPALVKASGEARVVAEADRVQIDLAVVTQAPEAGPAVAENAKKSQGVEAALRKTLGASASIESSGYSLSPNYTYVKGAGQKLDGYVVRNRLRISQDDVHSAGQIIDRASEAGASEVGQVQFVLSDDSEYRKRALELAAKNARERAGVMASALGLRVVRVMAVYEGQAPMAPMRQRSEAFKVSDSAGSPPTSILPGGVEIRASVTVEVEVAP
ncbi:MAG: SIMPL domain-containing protein [Myxococcota bacterium]|nr:SIMPL domain-containing protein [Myxococcota bacterium]